MSMFDYVKTKDEDILAMLQTKVPSQTHSNLIVPHRSTELQQQDG